VVTLEGLFFSLFIHLHKKIFTKNKTNYSQETSISQTIAYSTKCKKIQ